MLILSRHFALALFCFILLPAFSQAQPRYLVGTEAIEYFPHYGKNYPDSTEFSGYAREVLDAFFSSSDIDVRYQPLPIKRLYKSFFYDKNIDFKYPDSSDWKPMLRKGKQVFYSGPVGYYTDGLYVNRNKPPASIDDIERLGTMRGFTAVPYIEAINKGSIQLFEFSQTSDLLSALLAKQIDGAYLNIDVARFQIETLFDGGNSPLYFEEKLPYIEGHYRLSSIKHPELIEKLTVFLANNQQLLSDISNKWRVKPPPAKTP